jgi:FtsZ-interacting cell division protein ZipA
MINLIIPTLIVSTIAIVVSLIAIVLVLAQRWSTHKIEWKPLKVQDPFEISDKETKEADEDDGKILEEALNLQRKGKKQRDQDPLTDILETNNF